MSIVVFGSINTALRDKLQSDGVDVADVMIDAVQPSGVC